jgi:peroxiredoxin
LRRGDVIVALVVKLGQRFDKGLSCSVLDRSGQARSLSRSLASLLEGRAALLVFLRHFGCVGCDLQLSLLLPRQPELADLGVRIVLIGNGPPEHAAAFSERWSLAEREIDLVTDPSLGVFRAAGLERSAWATFGPQAMWSELLAMGAGQRPRRRAGDRFQQGGTLLLDQSGAVVFFHANRFVGDCVDAADVVDAAMRLRLGAAEAFAARGIV